MGGNLVNQQTIQGLPLNATTRWFVNSAFPVRENVDIRLLINGEKAFGAVADAIAQAKKTIDIISWGFDPAMRFKRPGGKRIGELLANAGKRDVKVRVLIWKNDISMLSENNLPSQSANARLRTEPGSQRELHEYIPGVTLAKEIFMPEALSDVQYRKYWFDKVENLVFSFFNVEFRTRDVDIPGWRTPSHAIRALRASGLSANAKKILMLTLFPSHHQKCVLIDYESENPDTAKGFVMGHNMLMNYWDTDAHKTSSNLRDADMKPWQDISAFVQGPVLFDLNQNFVEAWSKGEPWYKTLTGYDIASTRKTIKPSNFSANGTRMTVQISCTQPEQGKHSICDTYLQNTGKGWHYIYFENQYFRYAPLAQKLVADAKKTVDAGRKGILHVFVVTNVPDSTSLGTTYDMLKVLGKGHAMPGYSRDNNKESAEQAKAQQALRQAGIKALIGTLKTPEGRDIYVHSKLMLIDDSYFLLGSANINERSMYADSELAIATPNADLASQTRQRLWKLHTGSDGGVAPCTNASMAETFRKWEYLMQINRTNLENNPLKPLVCHLVDFLYTGGIPIFGSMD